MLGTTDGGNQAEAVFQQACLLRQRGQYAESTQLFDHVLQLRPCHLGALFFSGLSALQAGNSQRAVELLGSAFAINQDDPQICGGLGVALSRMGRNQEAAEVFEKAASMAPMDAASHYNLANALGKLERYEAAVGAYERAIALKPDHSLAYLNRGVALAALGRLVAAMESYDRAITIAPRFAEAHVARAGVLARLGNHAAAVDGYDQGLLFQPESLDAHRARGDSLLELRQFAAAVENYDIALRLQPGDAAVHNSRGNALAELRQYEAALQSYDHAVAISPNYAAAFNNRGNALLSLRQYEAALQSYNKAIELQPRYADAYHNRGALWTNLGEYETALADFDVAVRNSTGLAEFEFSRATALMLLKRHEAAIASFSRVLAVDPDFEFARGERSAIRQSICDWADFDAEVADLAARIDRGERTASPFGILAVIDKPLLQRKAAETWVEAECPASQVLPAIGMRVKRQKIRVGYFSADFRDHPVSFLIAGVFEAHNRDRFEVTGFSFGANTGGATRARVAAAVENFIDVSYASDREIAVLAREREIDIAIDLGGFTAGNRAGIFALRAAPIQVNFLGYPATMGAGYMDYLIADRTIVPAELQFHYAEKIAYLPSYLPSDPKFVATDREFTRAEMRLPETGIVFCCFNKHSKITPAIFDTWMRILGRVAGSVLWLSDADDVTKRNLLSEASARGIRAERLVFAERLASMAEHLARHRLADLFLDTCPYNAHTTASDALRAGLPLLTCIGQPFASRVAASLLSSLDLKELIVTTLHEYEDLAVRLAVDPRALPELKRKLVLNLSARRAFDTALYASRLETAYAAMYERYHSGVPPHHIHVDG